MTVYSCILAGTPGGGVEEWENLAVRIYVVPGVNATPQEAALFGDLTTTVLLAGTQPRKVAKTLVKV